MRGKSSTFSFPCRLVKTVKVLKAMDCVVESSLSSHTRLETYMYLIALNMQTPKYVFPEHQDLPMKDWKNIVEKGERQVFFFSFFAQLT